MKLPGYCERCHRIKHVHVSNAAMLRYARNQPLYGLCDACEEAEREEARARHPSRRGRAIH